jgi:hypothetical protein
MSSSQKKEKNIKKNKKYQKKIKNIPGRLLRRVELQLEV